MKSLINWIKKYTIYETDLRHRFMNIVLIVGMLTVPFCVILDAYLGTAQGSYKLMIVIFLLFLFSFMVANAFLPYENHLSQAFWKSDVKNRNSQYKILYGFTK